MKRLYISCGILLILFASTLFNSWQLQRVCHTTVSLLTEDESAVTVQKVEQAEAFWQSHMLWFDMVLNNAEIDHVDEEFQMLKDMITIDESETAVSQRNKLVQLIDEIWRTESVTLGNIL